MITSKEDLLEYIAADSKNYIKKKFIFNGFAQCYVFLQYLTKRIFGSILGQ